MLAAEIEIAKMEEFFFRTFIQEKILPNFVGSNKIWQFPETNKLKFYNMISAVKLVLALQYMQFKSFRPDCVHKKYVRVSTKVYEDAELLLTEIINHAPETENGDEEAIRENKTH